jgi:TonB family protein
VTATRRWWFIAAAIVLVAAGVALGLAVRPRTGTLVVTTAGPGDAGVEIYVDGRKRCDASYCALTALEPGKHRVTARAKGYRPIPDVEIAVSAGGESHCALMLSRMGATAIRVTAGHEGLSLSIDGKPIGPLPQTVAHFTPSVRRGCWEPAFNRREAQAPSSARVAVRFTVTPGGLVEKAFTAGDPKGYPGLARCVEDHVERWKFPRSGSPTSVTLPFIFP